MKSNTMTDFSIFLKYLPVFKKISLSSVTRTELLKIINELFPDADPDEGVSILDPFIRENPKHNYEIDIDVLRNTLADFFSEFLPGLLSEEAIRNYTISNFAGKVFVPIEEMENEDNQSYKYLYQMLLKKHEELRESFYEQKYDLENAHRDMAEQNAEIKRLRENNGNMKNTTTDIIAFIKDFLAKDIIIQKVEVMNSAGKSIVCGSDIKKTKPIPELADAPGIYAFKRPSWFTPLREELELSKKNISRKNVKHTEDTLLDKVMFWKLLKKDKSKVEAKARRIDETRKHNIEKLLASDISNEEKYIKYMLLTPGMGKEYMKTLNGAAELGLCANVVIELLEQPEGSFNKELIEAYVSQVHKATEYNLKLELAEELIRGEWYVVSEINGSKQKYHLVPWERIMEVTKRLEHISEVFEEYEKLSVGGSSLNDTKFDGTDGVMPETDKEEFVDSQIEYSDSALFEEPTMFVEPEVRDQEEMEILFVQQVENEFIKSSEES